ncbi:PREDICTED: ubinuclein-2-like isoform X1 [Poecilia mexicana]|uniref:Ubinuclein 2b n=1 Tax=Poecilia mexicana TaxID=48701 RepID=A0A3B3X8A1_9TELE|nr:PREDICTED: ubinuclein-2-like isoform X1 [Poecilia mexicana]XP_014864083.1 PREDICTED: ubinuclein-2-like isoform X1 [Poecilia mexicana]
MAEPRKVPFVTISSFSAPPPQQQQTPESNKKRRREDEAADITLGKDGGGGATAVGSGGSGGALFGNAKGGSDTDGGETKPTVRLSLTLSEPNEKGSSEFNYGELVQSTPSQVKPAGPTVPKGLTPPLDPSDPFADDEKERREVEELARKFESKYGGNTKKKKKDRMQDLIDIGYGYDETDPFIDNSEAYDELVPASLTTKHGGFYINTGTLQFRAASDSEGENADDHRFKKMKDGEERAIKKRRKKQDGGILEDKKPRKNKVPKPGVSALNVHRPEKKKRKKLMKDSLHLANMLRRFTREKEEMRKKNLAAATGAATLPRPNTKVPGATGAVVGAHPKAAAAGNDCNITDLTDDQAVMSLLGSANNDILQDMMGDLDFGMLDSPQPGSPSQGENGAFGAGQKTVRTLPGSVMTPPPPLPCGLPGPLAKRIEDLRAASRQFDEEGRKKFFTLDMNNILLDIELQVQEQPAEVRSAVYSHLEAFVPCNKEALLKRLKKLSLNVQDDRLRTPLLKLKLAVCSVMPEQIARYNMDCIAKVAKQQSEEGDKNGSEDDDDEKPGKRVMGPRKKFIWDDKLRSLLCNLVQVKLGFYELEGKNSMSVEDYLKAFMESEVKPLWPKGWMQARMLFKESTMVHGHLTGFTAKKKMVPAPKAKPKEVTWVQRPSPSVGVTPSPATQVAKRPPPSPPGTICLDSPDEAPSLDSISQALAILGNAAKGLAQGDTPPSPERPKTSANPPGLHASPLLQLQKKTSVSTPSSSTPHYITTSSSPSSALSRPAPNTPSPLTPVRVEGAGVVKATPQPNRHTVLNTQRPLSVGVTKANMPVSVSSPKPRPPPTASPLVAPGPKTGVSIPPSGLLKSSNNKVGGGDTIIITSTQSRPHTLTSPSLVINKTFQTPRLPQTPQNKPPSSLPQTPSGVQPQPQSNFITPMHATLTKSSHSSIPPIVKLTPRTPNPTVSPASTSSIQTSASISQSPRSQAAPLIHQYTPKTPASFRPPFSGASGGVAKSGQGSYTPSSSQKTPGVISATNTSLINTSSMSKHSGSSASPAAAAAASVTQGQRQRTVGGTPQGVKPVVSVPLSSVSSQLPQVSTTGSGGLLGTASSLPLGFGMLGGLVPVSLPFHLSPMLNLSQLGTGGSNTATSSSAASNSAAFSTLTQNLYKSLQSGSQVALPPHLQLAFSDVSQSQGGDTKRKTL